MPTAEDVIAEAGGWVGVPFKHQGRIRAGIDCAGLVIKVAHALGLSDFDITDYGRIPDGERMRALMREHMDELAWADRKPGDVILFRYTHRDQHMAILAFDADGETIIHARGDVGKVVETHFDKVWRRRAVAAFRYRGLA